MALKLDKDGLSTQTQAEIQTELSDALRAKLGVNLRTEVASLMGQLINVLSELRAVDQQTLLAVYKSFDPLGATGAALDARLGLTGSKRKGATRSVVKGLLTFTAIATAPQGYIIKNNTDDAHWRLINGPLTSSGAGTMAATFEAVDTGPKLANAGTSWTNVTIVSGITGFTNATDDAEPGRDRETDADARARRLVELYTQGQGPLAAIRAVVSKVDGVKQVRVYHNAVGDAGGGIGPDANGIPFKAFNVVVETEPAVPTTALRDKIFAAIWSATGAGGRAYGTSYTGNVIDSQGANQPVAFDVITEKNIYLELTLKTSTSENPITPNIATVVKTELLKVAQADHEVPGRDVRAIDYQGIVYAMLKDGRVSGVDQVTVKLGLQAGFADSGGAGLQKLTIGIREKPDFNSANVTVATS